MTRARNTWLGLAFLAASAVFAATPAVAGPPITQCLLCNYPTVDYTFTGLSYDVTNILVFGESDIVHDNLTRHDGFYSAPAGTSTISGLFGSIPIVSTLMIGLTTEVPGEPGGAIVLFTNDTFAANNAGKDFNIIFSQLLDYSFWYTDYNVTLNDYSFSQSIASGSNPANGEATLIADLLTPGAEGTKLPNGMVLGGSIDVAHFVSGQSVSVGSAGPGAIASAGFAPGDSFTAIAFSNGTIVGHGTSVVVPPPPVPEPATWTLMLMGVFSVGAGLRGARREKSVAARA